MSNLYVSVCKDGLCYYALPCTINTAHIWQTHWHAVQNIEEQFFFVRQFVNLVLNLGSPIKCKHV